MLHFTPHIQTQSLHTLWTTHTMYMHAHTHRRQTWAHTHTRTSSASWSQILCTTWVTKHCARCAMHRGLELRPRTYSPIPLHLSSLSSASLSTISLSHHFFLSISVFPLFFIWRKDEREEEHTEAMLYIEHGRVNEYLMLLFPLFFLSTVPFSNMHFLSSLSLSVDITSPVSLPPSLSVHPCTFLFRRAPLVPGTASHTRLMASLEGGREEYEAKMVTTGSHRITVILALS